MGEFDRHELTNFIGLQPTSSWNRGEKNPERGIPKCSQWDYSSPLIVDEIVDIYDLSECLIERLEPFAERIKEAIKTWNLSAVLQVVLRISMDDRLSTPGIGFTPRVLAFVTGVGGSIDIDTYRSDLPPSIIE